ncbi:MAG: hypothetical protein IJ138_09185 [Clostridia bacterium]|nr:hypothetical protein [Clostridia bacterium]
MANTAHTTRAHHSACPTLHFAPFLSLDYILLYAVLRGCQGKNEKKRENRRRYKSLQRLYANSGRFEKNASHPQEKVVYCMGPFGAEQF